MDSTHGGRLELRIPEGAFPLQEYRLGAGGRELRFLTTSAVLSFEDEVHLLFDTAPRPPLGLALWPASIALAHEVAGRADVFHGRRVLELGAGTGMPGIVADAVGGRVVQTERQEDAMSMCERNGARNGAGAIERRLADWAAWDDDTAYDWIIGSDILYDATMHAHLRRIFEGNLAPGGRVLIGDPFRERSLPLLEALAADGWTVLLSRWRVGEEIARHVGVYELAPPRQAAA